MCLGQEKNTPYKMKVTCYNSYNNNNNNNNNDNNYSNSKKKAKETIVDMAVVGVGYVQQKGTGKYEK